jgi:NTE family protein
MVVIGLNSLRVPPGGGVEERPDVFDGLSQVMQAVLADPLAHDVQTLATINMAIAPRPLVSDAGPDVLAGEEEPAAYRRVPYMFIAPDDKFAIGRIAVEVWRRHASRLRNRLRDRNVALLGTLVDAGRSPVRGELLSYLFFTPEFHRALVELGQQDARQWLAIEHDEGPWQYGPPPPTAPGRAADPPRAPSVPLARAGSRRTSAGPSPRKRLK